MKTMKRTPIGTRILLGSCLAVGLAMTVQGAMADTVKQLKAPSQANLLFVDGDTGEGEIPAVPNSDTQDSATAAPQNADVNSGVQSYSIVTESKVGPDGKRIQHKKVWKNGVLVEDAESTEEGAAEEGLSAEVDGQLLPGTASRIDPNASSLLNGIDIGAMNGQMAEMIQQMERNFNNQKAEILRRFGGSATMSGAVPFSFAPDPFGSAGIPIAQKLSEYWIGASVTPVPPEVAYMADIKENEGLFVREIVQDSPAAKAGLERFDIILAIGGRDVNDMSQIGEVIDESKDTPIEVSVIRKSQRISLLITPEKRPETEVATIGDPAGDTLAAPAQSGQIRVVRPGMIIPSDQVEGTGEAAATTPAEPSENPAPTAMEPQK